MKSIQRIKEITSGSDVSRKIIERVVRTPFSIKKAEERDDPDVKRQNVSKSQLNKLNKTIADKTKELTLLEDRISIESGEAVKSVGFVVTEAKKKANEIIKNAESTSKRAEELIKKAEQTSRDLSIREQRLVELGADIKSKSLALDGRAARVKSEETLVRGNVVDTETNLKEAQKLLAVMASLLLVAVKRVESLTSIDSSVLNIISQNIEKTDKMYREVKIMESSIRDGIRVSDEKLDVLSKKERLIKDRQGELVRAEKEVKRKINNG